MSKINFPPVPCTQCGTMIETTVESQRYRYRKTGRIFCQHKCGNDYREATRPPRTPALRLLTPCHMCAKPADITGFQIQQFNSTARAYCSRECSNAYRSLRSSETMRATNAKHGASFMGRNQKPPTIAMRAQISAKLKAAGHRPKARGGNGRPPTPAEMVLAFLLTPLGFVMQPAIPTKMGKGSGYPPAYKPDAGHWTLKVAIEADGPSHSSRRHLDAKKDACLSGLGWTVLRFSNAQILEDPATVLASITSKLRNCTPT